MPSYIVTDQKAFTGGYWPAGECQRVVVLAVASNSSPSAASALVMGYMRFFRIAAVDACFPLRRRPARCQSPWEIIRGRQTCCAANASR